MSDPLDAVIRPLNSADVPLIRELHRTLLPVQYPSSFFLHLLIQPSRACLIAHLPSAPFTPIAFITASVDNDSPPSPTKYRLVPTEIPLDYPPSEPEPRIQILTLGVHPDYQQLGLARRLVHSMISSLRPGHAHSCTSGRPYMPLRPATDTVSVHPGSSKGTPGSSALVYAHVSTSNVTARRFYERMGMGVCDTLGSFYRLGNVKERDWGGLLVMGRFDSAADGDEVEWDYGG